MQPGKAGSTRVVICTKMQEGHRLRIMKRTIACLPCLLPATVLAFSSAAIARGEEADSVVPLLSSWETQTEARTIVMSIPGPRGQITDRNGQPLAQNKVVYYLGLKFPYIEKATDADVLEFAHRKIKDVRRLLRKDWELSDKAVLEHYRHRRWLPLLFQYRPLTDSELVVTTPYAGEGKGLVLQPAYIRVYPRKKFAPHILGYVGKIRPLPIGPISSNGDPLWPETEGRSGLEIKFDEFLQGENGLVNHLFDADGNKLQEFVIRPPKQGNNLVTTLDADLQFFAEDELKKHTKRGAFVVMEIESGDILAMASWPLFDPNVFVPSISQKTFSRLSDDPEKPLYGRAFIGVYPPASTFKVPVALAALDSGAISRRSHFACPSSSRIGNRTFHNWNKSGEASMNVVGAIKRSCNTWFYKVGMKTGAEQFLSVARRLGLGEETGIPLPGEYGGKIPDVPTQGGQVANLSIGQGALLVTPLQVARMMAAVADGERVPTPRLVLQVQDLNNRVVKTFPRETRNRVNLTARSLRAVREGMDAVVSASNGTAKRARLKFASVAGKTGTGEWGRPSDNRRVGWFAGYLPADRPKYSFAVLYEGNPGEKVSGGGKAAPIMHDVFTRFFENGIDKRIDKTDKDDGEPEDGEEPEEDSEFLADNGEEKKPPRAKPVDRASRAHSAEIEEIINGSRRHQTPEEGEKRSVFRRFWKKIRGR